MRQLITTLTSAVFISSLACNICLCNVSENHGWLEAVLSEKLFHQSDSCQREKAFACAKRDCKFELDQPRHQCPGKLRCIDTAEQND